MAVFVTPIRAGILTDYLLGGALTLKNGRIDKYYFEGGFARAFETSATTDRFVFYYYNQDHLGNNREVVDIKGRIHQVTNYYPFGAPYADENAIKGESLQPYKYNGKELDLMHGLNTYDYGARQYDPILARWDRVDPLAEKYYYISPYAYCAGDPVNKFDPDGCRSFNVVDAEGKVRTEILDDGIDGTFSIQECDFFFLKIAYDMQQENNEGQYDAFLNSLGLDTKGYEVACKARQLERETPNKYAYNSDAGDGDGFTRGTYKCNKFAYDVLTSTDVLKKVPQGKPYPQAKQYAGEECIINGQFVSSDNYQPRLGDVIGGSYPFSDATGHVEIVTRIFPGNSKFESTGAHVYGLGATNMGYKMVNKQNVSSNRVIIYNPVKISRPK